jgi:hypothetical protein
MYGVYIGFVLAQKRILMNKPYMLALKLSQRTKAHQSAYSEIQQMCRKGPGDALTLDFSKLIINFGICTQ